MPPKRSADLEVFISHSHKDRKIAEALVHFLTAGVGIEPDEIRCTSYAASGLAIGSPIAKQLRKDIEECSFFMPLVTPNSAGSEFVAFEIGAAWALESSITPLVHCADDMKLPTLLEGLVYCDLKSLDSLVQLASELSKALFYASDRRSPNQMLAAARVFLTVSAA